MSHVSYHITSGLSQEQIERIHDAALGLIERVRLHIVHQPTLRHLANSDKVSWEYSDRRSGGIKE